MILAAHVIMTAYGFWLPNDPRGSWSDFVRSWELYHFGPATKIETRRSVAHKPYDKNLRAEMRHSLARKPVTFTGEQALAVGKGFAQEVTVSRCEILACCILPEHVHMVISRHSFEFDKLINRLKGSATRSLKASGLHPFQNHTYVDGTLPSPWTRKWWTVFLDSVAGIDRANAYVRRNPIREGKPSQHWSFVATGSA